ncbi:hypothetical protein QR680_007683 [Steinernema hermaphroditum]|uniref:Uncharacterized protein n=1 Tax=Steinernema hermaphroditum TaxID=289476 RepID=A0AA39M6C7_9BILA|nr:hypothetical protein QR680_007683 [Steinernema hermaphroditum]
MRHSPLHEAMAAAMDSTGYLNLSHLEEIIENDPDNLDQINYWYGQLVEFELEGNETRRELDVLFTALKWIMQYEHTAAEELKEIAEREATDIAEREENWEQEREILKEELSSLRERITSQAGLNVASEAFRDEIDMLKEENTHLKALNRERDRELADGRDKNEELAHRIEALEKEKNLSLNNIAQLEDTIRELNRRLDSSKDVSAKGEWEVRKLKQRSEQAMKLSSQLQNVVAQNDQLRTEVDRLSMALEEATILIQDSTEKYAQIKDQLAEAEKTIAQLSADNEILSSQLHEKLKLVEEQSEKGEHTSREYESVLHKKDAQLERFQETVVTLQAELEELKALKALDRTEEKEMELERLREELVEATNMARMLFGKPSETGTVDPSAEIRLRVLQLERQLEDCQAELKDKKEENERLLENVEEKDAENIKIHGKLVQYRQTLFGSADSEIKRLEKQLEFRDAQIEKLTNKCSLLHVELAELHEFGRRTSKLEPEIDEEEEGHEEDASSSGVDSRSTENSIATVPEPEVIERIATVVPERPRKTERIKRIRKEELDTFEASAMLISALNYEVMKLIEELEDKEKQMKELEHVCSDYDGCIGQIRTQMECLYKEYKEKVHEPNQQNQIVMDDERLAKLEIEVSELRRLSESVSVGGNELERRMAEATRRIIYLQIQNTQFHRRNHILDRLKSNAESEKDRMKAKLRTLMTVQSRQLNQINYENELNSIEIARMQNTVIHSVPQSVHDRVVVHYKQLLSKTIIGSSINVDEAFEYEYSFNIAKLLENGMTNEELQAKNRQLKDMVEILTDQNDYWKKESEKWKLEAEELKSFLVDVENETELKNMLGNIERRFLQALGEQTDSFQEKMLTERQIKRIQKDYGNKKREWAAEKRRLINIAMNLQIAIQRMRRSTINGITTDQLVMLKEKMDDLAEKELMITEKLGIVEAERHQVSMQLANVESMKTSMDIIVENKGDMVRLQRIIQADQLNTRTLTMEVKQLKSQVTHLQKEVTLKEAQIEDLKMENSELIMASLNVELYTSKDHKDLDKVIEKTPEGHTALELPIWREESDVDDLNLTSRSSIFSENGKYPKTRTIFYDNSRDFEKQIKQIRETARVCIQGYKEQLAQKDAQIEKYSKLLEEAKTVQPPPEAPMTTTRSVETYRPLKRASEIVNNQELEDKEREILRLRSEILDLETANARLGDSMRNLLVNQKIPKYSVGIQTDTAQEEEVVKVRSPKKRSPSPIRINIRTPPPEIRSAKSDSGSTYEIKRVDSTWKADERDVVVAQLRNEIKRLKTKNGELVKANKELTEACETIKTEAYARIEQRFGTSPSEADLEKIQSQLEVVKKELKQKDLVIRNLKVELVGMEKNSKLTEGKNQKEQVERWNEKKRREELIDSLKRRLREVEESHTHTQHLLERRDRRIEQFNREVTMSSGKSEEFKTLKSELKRQKEEISMKEVKYIAEIDSFRQRFTSMAEQVTHLQKENSRLKQRQKSALKVRTQVELGVQVDLLTPRRESPNSPKSVSSIIATTTEESSRRIENDIHTISRKLRITELRLTEVTEKFESLKIQYAEMEINYNSLLKMEKDRKRDGSAALAVLKDKLAARDKEVEKQRQKIGEMERRSWTSKYV